MALVVDARAENIVTIRAMLLVPVVLQIHSTTRQGDLLDLVGRLCRIARPLLATVGGEGHPMDHTQVVVRRRSVSVASF